MAQLIATAFPQCGTSSSLETIVHLHSKQERYQATTEEYPKSDAIRGTVTILH